MIKTALEYKKMTQVISFKMVLLFALGFFVFYPMKDLFRDASVMAGILFCLFAMFVWVGVNTFFLYKFVDPEWLLQYGLSQRDYIDLTKRNYVYRGCNLLFGFFLISFFGFLFIYLQADLYAVKIFVVLFFGFICFFTMGLSQSKLSNRLDNKSKGIAPYTASFVHVFVIAGSQFLSFEELEILFLSNVNNLGVFVILMISALYISISRFIRADLLYKGKNIYNKKLWGSIALFPFLFFLLLPLLHYALSVDFKWIISTWSVSFADQKEVGKQLIANPINFQKIMYFAKNYEQLLFLVFLFIYGLSAFKRTRGFISAPSFYVSKGLMVKDVFGPAMFSRWDIILIPLFFIYVFYGSTLSYFPFAIFICLYGLKQGLNLFLKWHAMFELRTTLIVFLSSAVAFPFVFNWPSAFSIFLSLVILVLFLLIESNINYKWKNLFIGYFLWYSVAFVVLSAFFIGVGMALIFSVVQYFMMREAYKKYRFSLPL